jgi:hypothetical protein
VYKIKDEFRIYSELGPDLSAFPSATKRILKAVHA